MEGLIGPVDHRKTFVLKGADQTIFPLVITKFCG